MDKKEKWEKEIGEYKLSSDEGQPSLSVEKSIDEYKLTNEDLQIPGYKREITIIGEIRTKTEEYFPFDSQKPFFVPENVAKKFEIIKNDLKKLGIKYEVTYETEYRSKERIITIGSRGPYGEYPGEVHTVYEKVPYTSEVRKVTFPYYMNKKDLETLIKLMSKLMSPKFFKSIDFIEDKYDFKHKDFGEQENLDWLAEELTRKKEVKKRRKNEWMKRIGKYKLTDKDFQLTSEEEKQVKYIIKLLKTR